MPITKSKPKRIAATKKHTCFDQANKELAKSNTKLSMVMAFSHDMKELTMEPMMASEKIDTKKRGSAKTVMITYCPFCGRLLKEED